MHIGAGEWPLRRSLDDMTLDCHDKAVLVISARVIISGSKIRNATLRVLPGGSLTIFGDQNSPAIIENCEIDCDKAKCPLQIAGSGVRIQGCFLHGSIGVDVIDDASLVLKECHVSGTKVGVRVSSQGLGDGPGSLDLQSCVIEGVKLTAAGASSRQADWSGVGVELGMDTKAKLTDCEVMKFRQGVMVDGSACLTKCKVLASDEGIWVSRSPAHVCLRGCEISGMGKRGPFSTGIEFYENGGGQIQQCTVQNFGRGVHVGFIEDEDYLGGVGKVVFKHSRIIGNHSDGVQIDLKATLENNEIGRNGRHGVVVRPEGSVIARRNYIHHNKGWGLTADHLSASDREGLAFSLMRRPRVPRLSSCSDKFSANGKGSVCESEPPDYPRIGKDGMPISPTKRQRVE